jgi:hypothetical protein
MDFTRGRKQFAGVALYARRGLGLKRRKPLDLWTMKHNTYKAYW